LLLVVYSAYSFEGTDFVAGFGELREVPVSPFVHQIFLIHFPILHPSFSHHDKPVSLYRGASKVTRSIILKIISGH